MRRDRERHTVNDVPSITWRVLEPFVLSPTSLPGMARPSLSHSARAPLGRCLRWIPRTEEPPFYQAIRRCCVEAHVVKLCFNCFRCFRGILQVFHMNVVK
jgi:hypothetical protein